MSIFNKYQKNLKYFAGSNSERLIDFITVLKNLTESIWDFNSVRYSTVMNSKQWNEFINHPDRQRFKSKAIKYSNDEELFEFIFDFLKDVYDYYKKLNIKGQNSIKAPLASLLDCTINAYFNDSEMRCYDEYVGRTQAQRDNGEINPTNFSIQKLQYAIKEYCESSRHNYKDLEKKIFTICEGRMSVLLDFLFTCDVEETFRKDILAIISILNRDMTLKYKRVKIAWQSWKKIREIGLDVESYLQLNDLPSFDSIKKNLLQFQNNKKYIAEIKKHIAQEMPESYLRLLKEKSISFYDLIAEEARIKKYSKKMRSDAELKKLIIESEKKVFHYLPLAQKKSPTNIIINPMHPEATNRAFQSMTKNSKGESINVIVMTPRSSEEDEYLSTLAHESTHAVHRKIIKMAEDSKILPKGASDNLPSTVLEDFSQLVEHEFSRNKKETEKKFKGSEFPNLMTAYIVRRQVPYSLMQLSVRKEFDKLWDEGNKDDLTDAFLNDLYASYYKYYKEWDEAGIRISNEIAHPFNLISPDDPDDGLVYMNKYIVKEDRVEGKKNGKAVGSSDMATAFRKRFGVGWLKSPDARIILHWLFLESDRNYKTETFYKYIETKNSVECLEELEKIGLTKKDIIND